MCFLTNIVFCCPGNITQLKFFRFCHRSKCYRQSINVKTIFIFVNFDVLKNKLTQMSVIIIHLFLRKRVVFITCVSVFLYVTFMYSLTIPEFYRLIYSVLRHIICAWRVHLLIIQKYRLQQTCVK